MLQHRGTVGAGHSMDTKLRGLTAAESSIRQSTSCHRLGRTDQVGTREARWSLKTQRDLLRRSVHGRAIGMLVHSAPKIKDIGLQPAWCRPETSASSGLRSTRPLHLIIRGSLRAGPLADASSCPSARIEVWLRRFPLPTGAIILAVRWSLRYSRVVPRPGGAAGGSVRVVRPETSVTAAISLIHPVLADVPALNS